MRKFSTFLFAGLIVASCGFRPLYSQTNTLGGDSTSLDSIAIDDIVPTGSSALQLKNNLIDRFYHHGYPTNAPYILKVTINESGRNIVIQKDNTTTRAQLVMNADYQLINRQTRETLAQGTIRAVGAYNVLQSQYTTLVTQNSARQAVITELADKITLRVAVVLDK